jgi:hypothetical protein
MRPTAALVAAGLALLAAGHAAAFRRYLTDDAFISLRYLEHWLAGDGLVYNVGERVWGFTNFGWIALLALPASLGADPLATARALGVACNALAVGLVLFALRGGGAAPRSFNVAGAALLVSSGAFVLQGWSGLETSAFTALVLLGLALWQRAVAGARPRMLYLAGFAAALATTTRPEGMLLFAALCWTTWRTPIAGETVRSALARLLLGFVPLVAAFELSMLAYYGVAWPNSLDAKVSFSLEQLRRGSHYVAVFASHNPASVGVVVLCAISWRSASALERCCVLLFGMWTALVALAGGDWMFGYRLFHTPIALSAVVAPRALERLRVWLVPASRARAFDAASIAVLCALNLLGTLADSRVRLAMRETYVHQGIRIGRFLREHADPGTVLATNTAGTIPYYSGLRVIDMMGLNDRVIAGRRDLPEGWLGIEKGDGRYVLSRRPDFIHFASSLGSGAPMFLSDIEIFESEEFQRGYDLATLEVEPGTTLRIYRRRETPRSAGPDDAEWARIREIALQRMRQSRYRYRGAGGREGGSRQPCAFPRSSKFTRPPRRSGYSQRSKPS